MSNKIISYCFSEPLLLLLDFFRLEGGVHVCGALHNDKYVTKFIDFL